MVRSTEVNRYNSHQSTMTATSKSEMLSPKSKVASSFSSTTPLPTPGGKMTPPSPNGRIRLPKGHSRNDSLSNIDFLCMTVLRHFKKLLVLATFGVATLVQFSNPLSSLSPQSFQWSAQVVNDSPRTTEEQMDYIDIPPKSGGRAGPTTGPNTTLSSIRAYKREVTDWQRYNASYAPFFEWDRTNLPPQVQVHLVVDLTSVVVDNKDNTSTIQADPASKMLTDAVERSPLTRLVAVTLIQPDGIGTIVVHPRRPSLPNLYVLDWGSMRRDCHRLQIVIEKLESQAAETDIINGENAKGKNSNPVNEPTPLLLIDLTGSSRAGKCDYLDRSQSVLSTKTLPHRTVRLAKRSIVQNRYYNPGTKQIHPGELVPNPLPKSYRSDGSTVIHAPLVVRESFVDAVQVLSKGVALEKLNRPLDVSFFWKRGDFSHYGFYRRRIGAVVKNLHHSTIGQDKSHQIEAHVDVSYSDEKGMEAGNTQSQYVLDLLSSKIVVIAQRDEWEDHYRLMESLASGALVLSDPMIAPPAGLEDKRNIVFYNNPKELKSFIRYYLLPENEKERNRIALEGFKLAMGRHRSWHRLEELLFGQPITNFDRPYAVAPEKEPRPESAHWVSEQDDNAQSRIV